MAEVKWIKIVTDIFDDEKMLLIESFPEADSVIVIWFKLLCMAGKQNNGGVFTINNRIAYTDEMLSTIFRRPLNVVRLALKTFEMYGMIEIVNDIITIPNWEKHQSLDKMELAKQQNRERVARCREKQRLIANVVSCAYCGASATGQDHIIPTARGGTNSEDNLVPCCIDCNRIKNDKPLVDFLNANRERIKDNLVLNNPKLRNYVTMCNVTHHYIVMESNADRKEIDKDKDIENNSIDENFETLWKMLKPTQYDRKSKVKPKRKKELYEMGDKAKKAIEVYLKTKSDKFTHARHNFLNDIIDNYIGKEFGRFDRQDSKEKSFDTESFFDAALKKSYERSSK